MELTHDTVIGILLIIAGVLAIMSATNGARMLRALSGVGAVVTIVIGVLLILGLA